MTTGVHFCGVKVTISVDEIKKNILERDKIDSTRKSSPLKKAPDAVEIDTSKVTIEEQVDLILQQVKLVAERKKIPVKNF